MKRMIASITLLTISVAVLIVLGTARKATAERQSGCSNATLRGSYGIHATGAALSGPLAGPVAFVGLFTFDGRGQLAGNLTQRVNGASGPITLFKVPYTGTYTLNADCTVEDTWFNLSNGTSSTHESVIVDNARKFVILNTTTGPTVVSGEGTKQFTGENDQN